MSAGNVCRNFPQKFPAKRIFDAINRKRATNSDKNPTKVIASNDVSPYNDRISIE